MTLWNIVVDEKMSGLECTNVLYVMLDNKVTSKMLKKILGFEKRDFMRIAPQQIDH